MKFGMPTLIEIPDMHQTVGLCKELGLSFVELNMNMPDFCPENLSPELVKDFAAEKKMEFTLHLPEEIDLASFHPSLRQGNIRRCCEAITWAGKAGIHLANLHINSGIYFTLPDQKVWIYERYQEQFVSNLTAAFEEIAEVSWKSGVKLCVENSSNFHYPFITKAIDRLVLMKGIFLTWDTGHDGGTGFKEKDLLLKYQDKVGHMHLHDYREGKDHQVLFTGEIDIEAMLLFAGEHDIHVVIEVKTVDSLRKSVERLKSIIGSL